MTTNAALQIVVYFLLILAATKPMGAYMAKVFNGERTILTPALGWVERLTLRFLGVKDDDDQTWIAYAFSLLAFTLCGMLVSYILLRVQGSLPLNPQGFGAKQMTPHLAFNTAASFSTNTNWQSYSPELAVSYFSNMVSLAIHNWMSAAAGIVVAIALIRGFARRGASGIGSFWVDMVRCTLYVLFPLTLAAALVFVWQGVPQNFLPVQKVVGVEGVAQNVWMGPVASQEAIKQLGTKPGIF